MNTGLGRRPGVSRPRLVGLGYALSIGVLLVSGCAAAQSDALDLAASASASASASGVAASAKRTDISSSIGPVRNYVTGAVWNHGRLPTTTAVLPMEYEASGVTGRLTYSESAGRSAYGRTQIVEARGLGNAATFEMTTRSTSTDPRTVLDVLHRSGNPRHDYLLTGEAYRSVAPTAWVTVPAAFGNGLGCAVPGRQVVCQVSADLLANQALDPSMPTNTSTTSTGTTSISSAITLRQLLDLQIWRLRAAVAPLPARVTAAELDRTLIPVTLSYDARPGPAKGRPHKLTIDGAVTVGGIKIAIDLVWEETGSSPTRDIDLPVPTKALYTILNTAAAQQLSAINERSE